MDNMVTGTTKSGFAYEIEADVFDDWDTLDIIRKIQNGDTLAVFDLITRILGEPISGLYNVGYDPNVEPEPDVVEYLLAEGYLPVVTSPRPEDGEGYHYIAGYELDGDHFVQVWERVDDPAPDPNPEISAERALNIILTGVDNDET